MSNARQIDVMWDDNPVDITSEANVNHAHKM